jgi:energy-coupling factor transport system permease protein
MSPLYDLYQPGHSWLHRLDPRTKVFFVICGFAMWLPMHNLWVMLGALAAVHAIVLGAKVTGDRIRWVWRMLFPTVAMIALLWVLAYPDTGRAFVSWWFVRIGARNLAEGLAVGLRIATLALWVFVWLFSTDQATLVRGLVALGLPYTWGLTIATGLRYMPTMANVFQMISDAQQARALDLSRGNPLKRARAYLPITVAMLITALRMAENLAHALESRALGAAPHRTYLRQLHFGWRDWLITAGLLCCTGLLLWARVALGFGVDPLRLLAP